MVFSWVPWVEWARQSLLISYNFWHAAEASFPTYCGPLNAILSMLCWFLMTAFLIAILAVFVPAVILSAALSIFVPKYRQKLLKYLQRSK